MKATLTAVFFALLAVTGSASAIEYKEGLAYHAITPEQPTSTKDKIEVVELFWYGCPHCHKLEPFIERWLKTKADYIEFVRMPAVLREEWSIHARAFYAAEALGVLEKFHAPFFTALHAHKRKLDTEDTIMEFFKEIGVSNDDYRKAFRSFSVDAKVRHAQEMGRRYGVNGTPAVIINGKFRTDSTTCQCGFNDLLKIVDYVAEQEKKNKK